jgi:threonylcarbamoyladenosine tRNA methylthiotransferase MtaB
MKIYFDTFGCRLNQAEIEKIAAQFRQAGHEPVGNLAEADLVVINTCAVTAKAVSDSRQAIRHASQMGIETIATGCWATLEPQEILKFPRVAILEKDDLVVQALGGPLADCGVKPESRLPLPGNHFRTRAFIKVQDGCDNFCTFCVTRIARGRSRSVAFADILEDIHLAAAGGVKEVVLTGVHLGAWGRDLAPEMRLKSLIRVILAETDIQRVRLSSLEPWDLDEGFFSLWGDRRLCRHLHLPLQSGSETILKAMGRKVTPESFTRTVEAARRVAPGMAITTDVMVGFPGETEKEFQECVQFLREMHFAGGHVFVFSPRPGTPAAHMNGIPPLSVAKERSRMLRDLFTAEKCAFQERCIGTEERVLWESARQEGDRWAMSGLTDTYIRVHAFSSQSTWNQISRVQMEKVLKGGLWGEILPDQVNEDHLRI